MSVDPAGPGGARALAEAIAAFRAAPLSRKKAMLVVLLADATLDAGFTPTPGASDILAYRAARCARAPALALVADLAAMRPNGPRLVLEAVEIPLAEYHRLSVEDFMVSLYNHQTVQRVRIALPDGSRLDALDTLEAAVADLAV